MPASRRTTRLTLPGTWVRPTNVDTEYRPNIPTHVRGSASDDDNCSEKLYGANSPLQIWLRRQQRCLRFSRTPSEGLASDDESGPQRLAANSPIPIGCNVNMHPFEEARGGAQLETDAFAFTTDKKYFGVLWLLLCIRHIAYPAIDTSRLPRRLLIETSTYANYI